MPYVRDIVRVEKNIDAILASTIPMALLKVMWPF